MMLLIAVSTVSEFLLPHIVGDLKLIRRFRPPELIPSEKSHTHSREPLNIAGKQLSRTSDFVAKSPIAGLPFGSHLRQHGFALVNVIVDDHLSLRCMQTMKSACILGEGIRAMKIGMVRNKRIEARIIEALTEIATGRNYDALLGVWDGFQPARVACSFSFFPPFIPPFRTMTFFANFTKRSEIVWRWSLRSVITTGERPASRAARTSSKII